jgi:hypothetical protein
MRNCVIHKNADHTRTVNFPDSTTSEHLNSAPMLKLLATIQPIIHHLRECLCGGNADVADQVEQILGFKLKHPFKVEKLGKVLLFIGAAGGGKTIFFHNLFGLAFGKAY